MMFRADLAIAMALFTASGVSATKIKNCVPTNVDLIKDNFEHPKIVCEWYNGGFRSNSPMHVMSSEAFTHACECILSKPASKKAIENYTNKTFKKTCTAKAKGLLANEVNEPKQFCAMWTKTEWRGRNPFPSMDGVGQLYNACECYEKKTPAKSSSTTTVKPYTTATSKASSKTSSTHTTKAASSTATTKTSNTSKPTSYSISTSTSSASAYLPETTSSSSTSSTTSLDASAAATATSLGFAKRYNQARHAAYRG